MVLIVGYYYGSAAQLDLEGFLWLTEQKQVFGKREGEMSKGWPS